MGGREAGNDAGKHEQSERVGIGVDRAAYGEVGDRERAGPGSNLQNADGVVADEHGGKREQRDRRGDQANRPVRRVLGDVSRNDEQVESEDDTGKDREESEARAGGVLDGMVKEDPEEGGEREQVGDGGDVREVVAGKDEQEHEDEDGRELGRAVAEPAVEEGGRETSDYDSEGDLEGEPSGAPVLG